MKTYKIYVLYLAREGSPPEPLFAFHAASDEVATSLKAQWARYHGHLPSEYGVEEWPEGYADDVVPIRDDYVGHTQSRLLNFYKIQNSTDPRPLLVESHLVTSKLTPAKVREMLKKVARPQFDQRHFITLSTFGYLDRKPLFGLAAMIDETPEYDAIVFPSRE